MAADRRRLPVAALRGGCLLRWRGEAATGAGLSMTGTLDTPFGPVSLRESAGRIVALDWHAAGREPTALEAEGLRQLAEYFAGERQAFDLALDWGEGLNAAVRRAMAAIPFGETRTYGEIASLVNAPAQAVGQACGANPIP